MRRERINAEAADWMARLAAPHDANEQAAFEKWQAIDIDHLIAFERQRAAWNRLNRVAAIRGPNESPDPDRIPAIAPNPPAITRRRLAAAAGILIAAGGGTALLIAGSTPAYATTLGEQRQVRLPDGSSVELNTNSKIVVRYERDVRVVELVRGEALFHIAKETRPFIICFSKMHLYSQEADVAVRMSGPSAKAVVKNGFVNVENATPLVNWPRATPLSPGSEAAVSAQSIQVTKLASGEIDRILAWQQGAVAFDGQPLSEVTEEFNRYNKRKLVIGDPALASLHVGGYFKTSNLDGFLQAIAISFGITASFSDNSQIILNKRG